MGEEVLNPEELSFEEGVFLVRLARRAIEEYVKNRRKVAPPPETPGRLMRKGMAFVTIETLVGGGRELRGCIGFLKPIYPLAETVINAAIAAATEDPRFPPLSMEELGSIVIEFSVLSPPRRVSNPRQEVVVGEHGIIVSRGWFSGTLLPQVPIEYCWDVETFLAEGCIKAGLYPDCWLDPSTTIEVYTARVFQELSPGGEVVERNLVKEYEERCR